MASRDPHLASMDVLSALEMTSGDVIVDAKISALNNLHAQKVRALMKSINVLKNEVAVMKAQAKEHRRSNLISGMREKIREQELIVDVLKQELKTANPERHLVTEEVNELIIKKTCGGPKRFRPRTREELQNDLVRTEKLLRKAVAARDAAAANKENTSDTTSKNRVAKLPLPPRSSSAESDPPPNTPQCESPRENTQQLQGQVSELLEEVSALKVALRSRDTNLTSRIEEMDRLRSENRELRRIEEKLVGKERKYREVKEGNGRLLDENSTLKENVELSRARMLQIQAEIEVVKEEGKIEVDALRGRNENLYNEVVEKERRMEELSFELERYKSEVVANRQTNYEIVRTKEGALADALKMKDELLHKNKTLEVKLEKHAKAINNMSSLQKESAVFKEKLRSETMKVRELTRRENDAEARMKKSERTSREQKAELEATIVDLEERLKEKGGKAQEKNEKVIKSQKDAIREKDTRIKTLETEMEGKNENVKSLKKEIATLASKLKSASELDSSKVTVDKTTLESLEEELANAKEKLSNANIEEMEETISSQSTKMNTLKEEKKKLMVKYGKLEVNLTNTKSQLDGSHIENQTLEKFKEKAIETEKELRDELAKVREGEAKTDTEKRLNEKITALEGTKKKQDETLLILREMLEKHQRHSETLANLLEKNKIAAPAFNAGPGDNLEASVDSSGGGEGASIFELSQSSAASTSISSSKP